MISAQPEPDRFALPAAPETPRRGAPLPFVRSSALEPFLGFLKAIGAPVERRLRQARIPSSLLDDPEALLPVFSAYRFLELNAQAEHIESLGVVVGQRASSFDLGSYGAFLQAASTVHEYLQIGTQLIGEHSSATRLWLTPERQSIRVNQYLKGPPGPGRCIADLYTLALTNKMLRQLAGPTWNPGEVRLLAGDEALLGRRDLFGDAPVITGQRHTSFTISRSLMQQTVLCSGVGVTSAGSSRAAARRPMPVDLKASVEQLILSLLTDGYPSLETAAVAAGMSPRTLQRRLAGVGLSYAGLVSTVRLRLARSWLTESHMPIAEIAAMLGYNEATNFARAFRRRTGVSPAGFRQMQARA